MREIIVSLIFLILSQNLYAKQNPILQEIVKMEKGNVWRILNGADWELSIRQIGTKSEKVLYREKGKYNYTGSYRAISTSKNGGKILFIRDNKQYDDRESSSLLSMKLGEQKAEEIVEKKNLSSAIFSLDENVILLVSGDTLESYNLITKEEKKIADGISIIDSLFPSGKDLICEYWSPWEFGKSRDYQIIRVNIETGNKEKIAEGKYAVLSPDGKKIIYKEIDYKDDSGKFHYGQYYTLTFETAKKDLLLITPQGATESKFELPILWSPDGRYVLFTKSEGWKGQLTDGWVMELSTKKLVKIGFTGLAWVRIDPLFETGKEEKPIEVFKWWHNISYTKEKD